MIPSHDEPDAAAVVVSGELAERVAALDAAGAAAELVEVVTANGERAYLISKEVLAALQHAWRLHQVQAASGEAFVMPVEDQEDLTEGDVPEPEDMSPPESWLVSDQRGHDG
ncbi:hypothetical protein [Nonomuraea sp. NPDC049784]|uniref:hypothetical protein n=1 Tax=Nonomuraea sp. NPDC049784 TaxID=3154361 RepID=UPI00341019E5